MKVKDSREGCKKQTFTHSEIAEEIRQDKSFAKIPKADTFWNADFRCS